MRWYVVRSDGDFILYDAVSPIHHSPSDCVWMTPGTWRE